MDFSTMSNEALAAALTEQREKGQALHDLDNPTVAQAQEFEDVLASMRDIEAEQASRAEQVRDAEARFAAARDQFSSMSEGSNEGAEPEGNESESDEPESDEPEGDEPEGNESEGNEPEGNGSEGAEPSGGPINDGVTTASARDSQRISAARKIGRKGKRPAAPASNPVTITAAADVPNFATGSQIPDMEGVTKALLNRTKGFAPYNAQAAASVRSQSGDQPVLHKFGVAHFSVPMDESMVATGGPAKEYAAVKAALKGRQGEGSALTAAGWCAPSETVYSWVADYVVDGLVSVPEVSAPRGGLMLTTGPERIALADFGFTQTEAEAEAKTVKPCETIDCPEFTDHRLDAIGYCFKIPLLTQKAYPELITDSLRYANALYAHKVNKRVIDDMVTLSTAISYTGLGAVLTDTLEALTIMATRERVRWNVGVNAVMEVKLPQWVREVFRADLSRRAAVAVDAITDQQIDAHFTARRLSVEYVSDWQEMSQTATTLEWPDTFKAMMFPAGTFIKAIEDVVNLSAVYDAASLSVNEYTGVFFEQGILVAKAAYGSSLLTIPICAAGRTGAGDITCTP